MPIARSSVAGAVIGVVLLAGCVGFAVGLPELVGEGPEADAAPTHPPVAELLPESLLDRGLVKPAEINPQAGETYDQIDDYGTTQLTEALGADTAVGRYFNSDGSVEVAVTITEAGNGLFLQTGPPVPPEMAAQSGVIPTISRVDDAVCSQIFDPQAPPPQGPPLQVQCQADADGLTFNIYATGGLTSEQVVEALHEVMDGAAAASAPAE